jgi:hypothetical protein
MTNKTVSNYCSICRHDTKHQVLFELKEKTKYGEYETLKQTVECLGCENKSFRIEEHRYWDTFEDALGNERYRLEIQLFPNCLKGHTEVRAIYNVPEKIREVYNQTILAFKGRSNLLTGVGFRAVIEAICIQEKIKGSNLEIKINNLAKNRLITDREAERLHSIRFIGNDSVHEMEVPNDSKLFLVLEIIENLLKNLYIIDAQAKSVLDTIIKNYTDFEDLLWRCSSKLRETEQYNIKQILGKHIRRINFDITEIEQILIERINNGKVKFLKLGDKKSTEDDSSTKQNYYFTGVEYDDLPF